MDIWHNAGLFPACRYAFPFRHLPVKKGNTHQICNLFLGIKKAMPFRTQPDALNLRKGKPPQNKCLRRSISLSISILTCTYFHCNAIHLPVYCRSATNLLPLFFQFISSILFCVFSGLVNAQSIVAYNRIAFLRFR